MGVPPTRRNSGQLVRLIVASVIALYGMARFRDAEHWDLLDDVNLAIHEAGHIFFQPLGDHPTVIGGSLFQVIVPAAFVAYFLVRQDRFAASVVLAWVGTSLANVALYIGDAQAQELPLLGGENAIHDWWYLLTEWDALPQDHTIANWVRLAGAMAYVMAVAGCVIFRRQATGDETSTTSFAESA